MTLWDDNYDRQKLEQWLYGPRSLGGSTRKWFLAKAETWPDGTNLLDAGCGGGVTAYQMAGAGLLEKIHYTGVDFSECMLDLADHKVRHENVCWVKAPLESMDLNVLYDRILLRAVLAHVLDPIPIIDRTLAHLVDDGWLYIVFWNNPVNTKSIINKIEGGFYDNSHNARLLEKAIENRNGKIINRYSVKEQSANSDIRSIWEIRKCQS